VGLSGIDAGLVDAEVLDPELGLVGRPVRSDARLLELLTANRYLPVVACVAGDAKGAIYNVNADQMAAACAASFKAEKLLFLTDVDGVRNAAGTIEPSLTIEQAQVLITDGVATGGMQAKLEAASRAIRHGVGQVVIAPGAMYGIVLKLMQGQSTGTTLVP
jgi:acetylglutamate kinase